MRLGWAPGSPASIGRSWQRDEVKGRNTGALAELACGKPGTFESRRARNPAHLPYRSSRFISEFLAELDTDWQQPHVDKFLKHAIPDLEVPPVSAPLSPPARGA